MGNGGFSARVLACTRIALLSARQLETVAISAGTSTGGATANAERQWLNDLHKPSGQRAFVALSGPLLQHPVLVVGKSDASQLLRLISTTDDEKRMPLAATPLSSESITLIRRWIDSGAIEGASSSVDPVPATVSISHRRHKVDVVLPTDAVGVQIPCHASPLPDRIPGKI